MSQLEVISNHVITNDTFANAHEFNAEGMRQYDHLIIGEYDAKRMFIAGLALGRGNVLLAGIPGGGKSTLLEGAHLIIDGIEANDIASIPHRTDLTPAQLIGDSTKAVKETTGADGQVLREEISAIIHAILTPDKKKVEIDEITRGNPFVLNAILGILAKRSAVINGVRTDFSNIELVASALNPKESLSSSFRAGAALASRQTLGAQLGNNTQVQNLAISGDIWSNNWVSAPEKVEKVIDLAGLHAIRASIPKVIVGKSLLPQAASASVRTMEALAESDTPIDEAIGRISEDIRDITKTLALLDGEPRATEKNLYDAVEYRVTGALTMRGGDATDVKNTMNAIYKG